MNSPKVILVVMDGWGYSPIKKGNAIIAANTPNFDYLWNTYAHTLLNAFGENVGLPWGSIGSSEVGHTSIGSGRLVNQELSLIDKEIRNGDFYHNEKILEIIKKTKDKSRSIHLVGLVSKGGVHSQMEHIFAVLKILRASGFKSNVFIHAFTDGRDTSPNSALQYIDELQKNIRRIGVNARIVSISGRFYGMDRDNRWERTKKAYMAMTKLEGIHAEDITKAIKEQYSKGVTDEFIDPIIIEQKERKGLFSNFFNKKEELRNGKIEEGDGVIFFNIRPDRMRQLASIFTSDNREAKTTPINNLKLLSLTTYDEKLPIEIAYPSTIIKDPLAKILSDGKLAQGHFAETEKYAHVTYFFDGGNSKPFPGEIWKLVPSPRVLTYDLKPEMSADAITSEVLKTLEKTKLDFVLINYANADMVGHTGVFDKVISAAETVDKQLGKLYKAYPNATILITADHGNAECMIHPETGEIDKKHTVNPVPFILVDEQFKKKYDPNIEPQATGILADLAPTILEFFGLKKVKDMTGISLIDSLK